MAIEINNRTKILAGVVVLAAAGAGAWFFLFQDEAPPPRAVVSAPKGGEAPKAKATTAAKAAEAPKAADAQKAADVAKGTEAPKPAAAKPIPTNPDQLVAEVIDASGMKTYFQAFAGEAARSAVASGQAGALGPDSERAIADAMRRVFDADKIAGEAAAALKANIDAERMARFLEILRQPVSRKMAAADLRTVPAEDYRAFGENLHKTPLAAPRAKLVQALDGVTRSSELGAELISAMAGDMVDAMQVELKKAGKKVPAGAREAVAAQLNVMRDQARSQVVGVMNFMVRNVSDDDLSAYVKLLDTDTGRWGMEQLVNAFRPGLTVRYGAFGKEIAPVALANRVAAVAKSPAASEPEPLPKAKIAAPAEATPVAAVAPAEPVGYKRPAGIKELYSRYNDLVSATVMRDAAAVKELLDDGKFPDPRQADGMTPLMIAAANGDTDLATMLLAKGANPNLRAAGGTTALSLARARGAAGATMVQLLQRSGAKD